MGYRHMRDFIEILITKFQQYLILTTWLYCNSHLVMSPKITAFLRHGAYVIVDGNAIKIERLNESQLRAQAVRLFEENYSYSVIAKKPGRCIAFLSVNLELQKPIGRQDEAPQPPSSRVRGLRRRRGCGEALPPPQKNF